jgi:hypothetical protein
MESGIEFRRTWKRGANGEWQEVEFERLRVGDVFKLEDTSKGVTYLTGKVGTTPQPCEPPGNWTFESDGLEWHDKDPD